MAMEAIPLTQAPALCRTWAQAFSVAPVAVTPVAALVVAVGGNGKVVNVASSV